MSLVESHFGVSRTQPPCGLLTRARIGEIEISAVSGVPLAAPGRRCREHRDGGRPVDGGSEPRREHYSAGRTRGSATRR